MNKFARPVAALGALIGLFGLVLQYVLLYAGLSTDGASALDVLWRFYAYFTLLTNTLGRTGLVM